MSWWHARQRAIDLRILWPICKEKAPNLEQARLAFAMHAMMDPAWLCLGREEIEARVFRLQ